jgi:hypothetical protein
MPVADSLGLDSLVVPPEGGEVPVEMPEEQDQ